MVVVFDFVVHKATLTLFSFPCPIAEFDSTSVLTRTLPTPTETILVCSPSRTLISLFFHPSRASVALSTSIFTVGVVVVIFVIFVAVAAPGDEDEVEN